MTHLDTQTADTLEALVLDPLASNIDIPAWRHLAETASDANPFFGPEFLVPFLKNMASHPVKLIVIRHTQTGEWLIAAPVGSRRLGFAVPAATIWTTEYAPLGTPLLASCTPKSAITLFLEHAAKETGSPLIAIPYLPMDTTIAAQLLTVENGWKWKLAHEANRAGHSHGVKGEEQFAESYSGKRRKEFKRLMRRLSDEGEVRFDSLTGQDAIVAFDAFLELEAAGWKGRKETALKSEPDTLAFSQNMIAARARTNGVRIDSLNLSGKPVAMLVLLREGHTIFSWKIAFDESYARYSPGGQLALYAMQTNLKDPDIWAADSLAVPGHSMIEPLWRGRIRTATLLLAKSAAGRMLLSAAQTDTDLEQGAKAFARKLLKRSR